MHPPMFRQINAAFRVRGKPVLFCWGDTIYNPAGITIHPSIRAHEAVHVQQQAGIDPELWWKRYIDDKGFRLDQEIPAHRAEYQWWVNCSDEWDLSALDRVAARLCSPLYGSLIGHEEARRLLIA